MDGQDLALEDDSFDCAAALFGIMLFPDRARGFSELARVVRPGGRVAVTNWTGPDRSEAFQVLMTPMKAAFPDMPPPPAPPPVFSLSDPEVFRAEMEAAGLTDVKIDAVERGMEVPDVDVAWSMFTTGAPPARALMGQIGEDGSGKLRAALEVHVSERWGDGPIRLKNTALVGTGTVA